MMSRTDGIIYSSYSKHTGIQRDRPVHTNWIRMRNGREEGKDENQGAKSKC